MVESTAGNEYSFRVYPQRVSPGCPVPIKIEYKDEIIRSEFRLDLIVEDTLIVELKSVETLMPVHFKQLRTYMKLLDKPVGLLVNFDVSDFRTGYKVLK